MITFEYAFENAWTAFEGTYLQAWKDNLRLNKQKAGLRSLPLGLWSEVDMQSHLTSHMRNALNGGDVDVVNEVFLGNTFKDSTELFACIKGLKKEERFAPDIVVSPRTQQKFGLIAELKYHPSLSGRPLDTVRNKRLNTRIDNYLVDVEAVSRAIEVGIAPIGYFGLIEDRFFDDEGLVYRHKFEDTARNKYPKVRLKTYGLSLDTKKSLLL